MTEFMTAAYINLCGSGKISNLLAKNKRTNMAKPFIKWAGGKSQLKDEIISRIPSDIDVYVEPFVGEGAVFFALAEERNDIEYFISDTNGALISSYMTVRDSCEPLIGKLKGLENAYRNYDMDGKKQMFLEIRENFNRIKETSGLVQVDICADFIFLNKTGFNGLYRENSGGRFNVPFGYSEKPLICDKGNIRECSRLLNERKVYIRNSSYDASATGLSCKKRVFFYLDPPYRPVTKTAAFTAYSKDGFNDDAQRQLKSFCDMVDRNRWMFLQSNSFQEDGFFDDLYKDYAIDIVSAKRNINSDGKGRGTVKEILVSNF